MRPIALIISNEKEKTVLEHYFQSLNFKVLVLRSDYMTFRQIVDAYPICVICELPPKYMDNLYVIRLLSNQKKTDKIPVIAYGNHSLGSVVRSFYEAGVELYYQRPLQSKLLTEDIEEIKCGRSIKIKRYRSLQVETQSSNTSQENNTPVKSNEKPVSEKHSAPVSRQQDENSLTLPKDELEAIESLMNPITLPEERIGIIIGRVKEMLAFPFTIVKILEITQNDKTGASDLAKAIEADPVIVSKVLSISNTVQFAQQGKRINDVKEAIIRLGFIETKNIALSLSVMSMFSTEAKSDGFNRFEFWYHSLACGIFSEMLAKKSGYQFPEKAFICGLLHDFGIILLDEFFNSFFSSIYKQVLQNKSSFISEEKHLWGMSHNRAVAQLFKAWNMPADITYTIAQLDMFGSKQSVEMQSKDFLLINTVGLSNLIVKSLQFGKDCDEIIYPVDQKILENLNCPEGIGDEIIDTCVERLNIYTEFFGLEKRSFAFPPKLGANAQLISIVEHTKELFYPHKYFFQTCGYKICDASSFEKIKKMEERPHAILNLINSTIPEKYLEPFASLPKDNVSQSGNQKHCIPAIFVTSDKESDLSFKSLRNAYCLPASVDLNILRTIIEGLISQQEVKEYDELLISEDSSSQQERILTINYLNDQTVLINLNGIIRLNCFNEIKMCFMKMVEKKIPYIAVQVSEILDIDNLMMNLLLNFQKKIVELGCAVCFCCIGQEIPKAIKEQGVLKSIQLFNKENEVIVYLSKIK